MKLFLQIACKDNFSVLNLFPMGTANKKDMEFETKIVDLLKSKELSVTVPRKTMLGLLIKEHGPFTTEEIHKKLPKNFCDLATVYRCLNQFVDTGLVSMTYLDKDLARYEFNDPHHHHHHIICKICKRIDSFHDCMMEKIESTLTKKGYREIQHRLEFFGVCESCQK